MKAVFLIAANLMREIFRKKDFYVLLILLLFLMVYLVNAAFFGITDVFRYMKEIGLGMVFLFSLLISVPFAAKVMIEEAASKTIYPLLAKPLSRFQVIAGKFLGSLFVAWCSFGFFFFLFVLASVYKQGAFTGILYFQVYVSGLCLLLVLTAMTLCLSVYCTFSTTITLAYMIYFLMSWFGAGLHESLYKIPFLGQAVYYALPHFEFFDLRHRLIHLWEPVPGWVMLALVAYACLYSGAMLMCARCGFNKRWL